MLKRIAGYFLRGLLLTLPTAITVYLLIVAVRMVDEIFNFGIPGLGLIAIVGGVTLVGFIFTGFIGNAVFGLIDEIMSRTPLVKLIYSSVKDMIEAFVGEKKRFNEPVVVKLNEDTQIIGFLTRKDLENLGLSNKVAVYIPFSYSMSGHVIIVPSANVTRVYNKASEVMKFLISGGVSGLNMEEQDEEIKK